MNRPGFRGIILLILVLAGFAGVSAAVPQTMNYQGYLTDSEGNAVTTGETPLSVTFSIYDTAVAGPALWTETQNVTVTSGVYSVILGSTAPLTIAFDRQYWLGVKVETDAEMTPRHALSTVPTAFRAREADAVPAGTITDAGISATAAIQASKIAGLGSLATKSAIDDGDVSPTAAIQASKISGLGALAAKNSVDSTDIADNSIVNADISPTAAIVDTKLATISTGGKVADSALSSKVVLTNSSGDITLSGNLNLPAAGIIKSGANRLIYTNGTSNFFAGNNAGNTTMTATGNTAVGSDAFSSNATGSRNTAVGTEALFSNFSGSYNTANGWNALNANTSGSYNTASGYMALYYNTEGNNNTAIGHQALYVNTIGTENTAVGTNALFLNETGSSNTAIGNKALNSNTTASRNTAVGVSALFTQSYSTGTAWDSFNTAVGFEALYLNQPTMITTGISNTALGGLALRSNIIGAFNTASGTSALKDNTTGMYNTASGSSALQQNTAGMYNTAAGYSSLSTNIHGSSNTALGFGADVAADYISNATAIGYNAKVDASNHVRIGDIYVSQIGGEVGWSNLSDMRSKKDVRDISFGLAFIQSLRPVQYRLKQGNERIDFGFIAQEIEARLGTDYNVLGIAEDADRTLSLRYTDFIAPMVKAMQEQQEIIDRLNDEMAQRNVDMKQMRKELDELRALLGVAVQN